MIVYRQCQLQKGERRQTAWIPRPFAKVGLTLRLKDDDGWRVVSVGAEQPYDLLREFERQSLPSVEGVR